MHEIAISNHMRNFSQLNKDPGATIWPLHSHAMDTRLARAVGGRVDSGNIVPLTQPRVEEKVAVRGPDYGMSCV